VGLKMKAKSALQIRLDEAHAIAIETFGSKEMAEKWLHSENFVLKSTPISMVESESGLLEVKRILNAISDGGVI
jgi:uncharacterized protein (DUF2384 family)